MESAVSFAPLRPADFVNFAARGGAGQGLLFAGWGGAACFSAGRGGSSIPALNPFETVSLYLYLNIWLISHQISCQLFSYQLIQNVVGWTSNFSTFLHLNNILCAAQIGGKRQIYHNVTKEHPGERVQISKMHVLSSKEAGRRFAKCASGYLQCVGAKVRKKLHGAGESGSATSVPL